MRIVDAAEAVAGIRSGEQVYLHCAAATPSVLLDALVARAPDLRDVGVVHLHCEGPGPHLAPEMAPHFRHRALFIGPNARAAVNEGRADYVPIVPLGRAAAVRLGGAPARCRVRQRHAARSSRVLFAGDVGGGHARGDPGREDGDRPVQPIDAANAGEQLHPRDRHRPRGRGGRSPVRASNGRDRRCRATHRRARRRPRAGRRHAATRDRGHPRGRRHGPRRQARPGHPYRDVHGLHRRPGRSRASSPAPARSATAARS